MNIRLIIAGLLLFILPWIQHSCTKDTDVNPEQTFLDRYYPLSIGDIRTYQVDSITYDYDAVAHKISIDTSRYYLQERVETTIQLDGTEWYRIAQWRKSDPGDPYILSDYVFETIDQQNRQRVLRKEGHLIFIPLATPLRLFDEWDGTAYFDAASVEMFVKGEVINPYADWKYIYLNDWETYTVGDQTYESVIQINQRDTVTLKSGGAEKMDIPPENQLFYQLANEFYAPGTGLVMKENIHLTSICASSEADQFKGFCDTTTIFQNAERGFIYRKMLTSFE